MRLGCDRQERASWRRRLAASALISAIATGGGVGPARAAPVDGIGVTGRYFELIKKVDDNRRSSSTGTSR